MDLSRIRHKLDEGEYKDPWDFINDVKLIIENWEQYEVDGDRKYRPKMSKKPTQEESEDKEG